MLERGPGLGLAVSLGIVEKHSGKIDVKSEEGEGDNIYDQVAVEGSWMKGISQCTRYPTY